MNRRTFVARSAGGLVACLLPAWPRARARDRMVERWSWVMGQPVHVILYAASEDEGFDACAAALAELRRVEARLSLFDEASDLCELNRHAGRRSFRVDHDLRAVLHLAREYRAVTHGAFDPAVEPLMRVWGLHQPRPAAPTPTEIAQARDAVGAAVILLDGDVARLPSAHTQLDFGGIGVGYGIDRALAVLRRNGIERAFIDVSGDCGAIGAPPGERGWRVEIAGSRGPDGRPSTRYLRDAALATSANSQAVLSAGRAVRGHVIDPATGWPADAQRQVSILARTAVAADAFSTGALITGTRPAGALGLILVG